MSKVIGLTGGIGSGKTTVAKAFEALGVPVYIADDQAATVTQSPEAQSKILTYFGPDVFQNGKLDRKKLGNLVFSDPEKLKKLNAIIHPLVANNFLEWRQKNEDHPFVIKEAAILFESGSALDCDKIITVTAPLEVKIQRVMQRDQVTQEAVLARIANQWTDAEKIAKSDYVIENLTLKNTQDEVRKIYKKLMIL